MGLLNQTTALLWQGGAALRTLATRRTSPPLEHSQDRVVWFGGKIAGVHMNADEALRLSAVWACVSVISKALASCRWEVFQEQEDGDREMRRNTITYKLLNIRPNPEMTAFAFREAALIQALIYGNFMAEIETDTGGRPVALWPINPDRWTLERSRAGGLVVRVINHDRADTILDYADVFHLHGPGIDGLAGFDVVSVAARSFAHAAAAERFGQAFYANGTSMGGVLTGDEVMDGAKLTEFREQLESRHKGPDKAFSFLYLGGPNLKYHQLSVTPENAQFIETRQLLIEEVSRWFGVPPHKIQHLLRATFNNIEHLGIEFVRDALVPWAERLAQEADEKLIPRHWPFKTRIDLDFLAEGDAKSKAETDAILVNNGIRTRNEIRRTRGWNKADEENADSLTVQLAMTTLDKIGLDEPEPTPPPEPDPDAGDPGMDRAAKAMFGAAMKRCLKRRFHRAEDAAQHSDDLAEFRRRVASEQVDHSQYAAAQIMESMAALDVTADAEAIKAVLVPVLAEEPGMLATAYEACDLAAWCDIDSRAQAIGDRLAEIVTR